MSEKRAELRQLIRAKREQRTAGACRAPSAMPDPQTMLLAAGIDDLDALRNAPALVDAAKQIAASAGGMRAALEASARTSDPGSLSHATAAPPSRRRRGGKRHRRGAARAGAAAADEEEEAPPPGGGRGKEEAPPPGGGCGETDDEAPPPGSDAEDEAPPPGDSDDDGEAPPLWWRKEI